MHYKVVVTAEAEEDLNRFIQWPVKKIRSSGKKIDETDDYVRLPNQYELHEKSIMEKFAYESGNKRVSEVLFDALRRRHPYRCFKDKINDLGISQIYYDYRNRTYINIAEEWCRNHHVPYRRKED